MQERVIGEVQKGRRISVGDHVFFGRRWNKPGVVVRILAVHVPHRSGLGSNPTRYDCDVRWLQPRSVGGKKDLTSERIAEINLSKLDILIEKRKERIRIDQSRLDVSAEQSEKLKELAEQPITEDFLSSWTFHRYKYP